MDFETVMRELEEAGTAQNRKIYARHGLTGPFFGVSFAKIGELKKRIKKDHALAERLWATGNADARVLATKVADPKAVTPALLDAWVLASDNFMAGQLAELAAATPHAAAKAHAWIDAGDEWTAKAGWMLLARLAMDAGAQEDWAGWIARIEREIGQAPNMVKDAMNSALIAIGMRDSALESAAIAAARRIGPVVVDHGETGCKTPEAEPYILKARARKEAQAEKRAAKRK